MKVRKVRKKMRARKKKYVLRLLGFLSTVNELHKPTHVVY